jgi:hypothetical protein
MFSTISTIQSVASKPPKASGSSGSLLYYYTFDTATVSGLTVNPDPSSTNTQPITLSSTLGLTATGPIEGDRCFTNGATLYYALANGTLVIPTNNGLTVSFWFNVLAGNGTANEIIFGLGAGGTNIFYVFLSPSSNQMLLYLNGSNLIFNQSLTTGTWRHIAITWVGSTCLAYINGASVSFTTYVATALPNSTWSSMSVGRAVDNVLGNGYTNIDCVRVYNKVLTQAQIQTIYAGSN